MQNPHHIPHAKYRSLQQFYYTRFVDDYTLHTVFEAKGEMA